VSPARPAVRILGRPGLRADLLAHVLTATGVEVLIGAGGGPGAELAVAALLRGADAVVEAETDADQLVAAVETVAGGGAVVTPELARTLLESVRAQEAAGGAIRLTPREADILRSIDGGDSVKQTARTLGISIKTVENLQSRMFRKLEARNRAQAITRAHALGLLDQKAG
jgi:DNA-binding NarL/FixJ family response regulator